MNSINWLAEDFMAVTLPVIQQLTLDQSLGILLPRQVFQLSANAWYRTAYENPTCLQAMLVDTAYPGGRNAIWQVICGPNRVNLIIEVFTYRTDPLPEKTIMINFLKGVMSQSSRDQLSLLEIVRIKLMLSRMTKVATPLGDVAVA